MTVPQITPPPLLPAPPFTSPVEVEGKLYIAQETFGAANKHMLQTMRLYLLDARMRAWALKDACLQQGRPGSSDCCPPQYRFLKDTCCVIVDSRHAVGEFSMPRAQALLSTHPTCPITLRIAATLVPSQSSPGLIMPLPLADISWNPLPPTSNLNSVT